MLLHVAESLNYVLFITDKQKFNHSNCFQHDALMKKDEQKDYTCL